MAKDGQNSSHGGYEKSDASLKSVMMLVALTAGLVLVGIISMWGLVGYIVERHASQDAPPSPLAETRIRFHRDVANQINFFTSIFRRKMPIGKAISFHTETNCWQFLEVITNS